jgi:hypothetical protein
VLAAIGMLVTEEPIEYHPLFEAYNKDIGPAIRHLDEVRATEPLFFVAFGAVIGALEWNRAKTGFSAPEVSSTRFKLRHYIPCFSFVMLLIMFLGRL